MSEIKVERGDWVVVCDGAKALLMENVGNWLKPSLKTRDVYTQPDPSTHEIGSDAPGRSFSSVGSGRSAMEQTDWHDEAERAFLEQLGPADGLSFVPGNHDAYTRNSPARLLHAFDPWMRGDDAGAHPLDEAERFPYVRIRDRIALIGVSSAVPTGPFMATGRVGIRQMSRLRDALEHLGHEGYCRIIMIHHPVRRQDAAPTAMLVDADHFQRAVRAGGGLNPPS